MSATVPESTANEAGGRPRPTTQDEKDCKANEATEAQLKKQLTEEKAASLEDTDVPAAIDAASLAAKHIGAIIRHSCIRA